MRTVLTLINWLFGELPLLKWLNGKKTYIGFILWVLSFVAEGLVFAAGFFPEAGLLEFHAQLLSFLKMLEDTLQKLGIDMIILGVGHKATKEAEEHQKIKSLGH